MKPLSKDIRSRLVAAKEAGEGSVRVLAEHFKVGSATVQRLFTKLKETKSIEPLPHGGGMPAKIPDSELSKLIELVKEKPDRTIEELINEWRIRYGINVSSSAMSRTLERCNLSLKKTFTATERDTEKNIEKRRVFESEIKNIPEKHRVYLDEAGTNLGMTRMNSRSAKGERASSKRPSNRGTNISLIGAVRLNEEPVLYPFDGAVDGEKFVFFLKEKLLPILKDSDVVIMDNCRIHYVKEVAEILKTVGARPLFLPPYSPELNPIEEAWSLIKYVFKSLEARTISAYIDTMQLARKIITHEKINQYYQHANSFLATT